ncbi:MULTISPECIES: NACHT domain-containing protein [unclassified Neochlamydia]|uniref:NACHT domain-containing protein n=1 Tax=unclassified Neochlamydia TaxID=2643326 RepID=UPI00140BA091|nr:MULTISPECIES: NACHT domain-containing protein [unclassified Neochlamydia]MBS4166447.1 Uncharacterized protein [Neochlamydia sp. AcF65]MBS4169318.1 Uncharacterized protein [Neochlamydia sp. AcF95]NGY95663.1 hypothetical protein [Neochlamydia sp. AcF84]
MQATPGHFNVQANASQIHLEQNARLLISSTIQYHALQPLSQVPLNPQTFINSLQSLYLSQKTLSIFRIKAEQEWEFKVPLEEIYVRLGIIESKERRVRDQALDKHSEQIQDERLPTSETIYESKENIEIEKLFEHKSLEKENAKRIYIQGAAGIGKSTLCHYIAYRWAKEELWQGVFSYLFWIPLRNLTLKKYPADKEYTPADLIAREYAGKIDSKAIEACINDATLREKTLLVLDGYDELSAEAQGNTSLATAFKELKELFPHILITSRPGSCSFNRSCELELLGFDKEGVERYIDRFFKQVQSEDKKQKLYHLFQSSPQVLSLAQIPINLTLLCCLFNEDPEVFDSTQSITMTAIYERIVNWMYKWFLLRRIDQGKSNQTKEKILAEKNLRYNQEVAKIAIAFEEMANFAMKTNTLYLEEEEIDHFRGKEITANELIDCGLLRIPEEKGYFIHLTFQEFLTASKVANQYLRGENRQACQDFVHNYKFEPRYNLVMRMIAGYLSLSTSRNRRYLDSNPLQSFFDDLFADPRDLAARSELNLIANCFEECQNPAQVRQYEGFVELVKDYITHFSLSGLNFEMLLRNKNLLTHPKITYTIERLLSDPQATENTLANVENLIRAGQRLVPEIVRFIAGVVKDHVKYYGAKDAIYLLKKVAGQGGEVAKKAVEALIQIIKEGDRAAKVSASRALREVIQEGAKLAKGSLNALIIDLQEGDRDTKDTAIYVLRAGAQQGDRLPEEALDALTQLLQERDYDVKMSAIKTLRDEVEQGGKLPREAVKALTQLLQEDDRDAKVYATYVLCAAVNHKGELNEEAINVFIQLLHGDDRDAIRSAAGVLGAVSQHEGELSKKALDALSRILKEGDCDTKMSAIEGLGKDVKFGGGLLKKALDALIQILQEGDLHHKLFADMALIEIAQHGGELPGEAINAFTQLLKHGERDAKMSASNALREVVEHGGELPTEAISALIQLFRKGDSAVKMSACWALRKVAQQEGELAKELLSALSQILKEGDTDAKRSACWALKEVVKHEGELSAEAIDALIQILHKGDSYAKTLASDALRKVVEHGGELSAEAIDALILIFHQGDSAAISSAAYVLGVVAEQRGKLPKKAIDALIQILTKGDLYTKTSAVEALRKVTHQGGELAEETLDALSRILKEGDSAAINSAAHVLEKVVHQGGELPKEVLDALSRILNEDDSVAINSAAHVLGAVAWQGSKLPKKAINALILILKKGDSAAISSAAHVLGIVAQRRGKLPKKALDSFIQIFQEQEVDFEAQMFIARTLGAGTKYECKLTKRVVDALFQILLEGDYSAKSFAISALGTVVQQGGELSKGVLDDLIQILEKGDRDAKMSAAAALKEIDKNALLKMNIQAFPLIAKICFFTESSFSVKSQQFQISDKRTIYSSEQTIKLNYEELKEKLPTEVAIWRRRLDSLSQIEGSSGLTNQI